MEWLIDTGAGRYVPGDAELVDEVAELAEPGSASLLSMRRGGRPAGPSGGRRGGRRSWCAPWRCRLS